nr:O-antigen biosynthesis protein [Legionella jordanis]
MEILLQLSKKFPLQSWVSLLLAATLLALPLSSTGKSIAAVLSVITIIMIPEFRRDLRFVLFEKWSLAALALFSIAVLACLWSPADWGDKGFVIEKYSKLLYLPILAVGFQDAKTRQLALYAFLLAVTITCMLSILKFHGFLSFFQFNPDRVFRNHIMTGFMVAFGTYLSFLFAYRHSGYSRYGYVLLGLLFSYQELFVNGGRTGYVLYFLMMGLLIVQLCSLKQAIVASLLVITVFAGSYSLSPVMKGRVNALVLQIKAYQQNQKDSDIGFRLQFHDYAHQLFNRHPLFGNGTASFTYFYAKEAPVPGWFWKLWEPHSQYWLIAAEFGLLGITGLFLLFFSLIRASFQLNQMRVIAFAMLLPFMIGNLSDSLLFYSGSGYFFLLFMALCLGEKVELDKNKRLDNRTSFRL